MIYTCTITPSIDYTVYLPAFNTGELNRADKVYYYPGGKGINVSRVLKRLGVNNTALGFSGGFTGEFISHLLSREGVSTEFIDTEEITRINVKIKADQESELNGPGPDITDAQQQQLLSKLEVLSTGDWFVLAGSLPETIPFAFYEEIANACREKGACFVLDTSGPNLRALIETKPFLIKPNEEELGELFDTTISTIEEAVFYAEKLVETGIQYVIVSLGGDGAILAAGNETLIAEAPAGKVINTVGSGDSLVAGFIASYAKDGNAREAFRYGVASGSATAFLPDLCEAENVAQLMPEVKLHTYQKGAESNEDH
jgi:1-phosphofructokinase